MVVAVIISAAVLVVALLGAGPARLGTAAADGELTILGASPTTLDPAAQGDAGSAAVTAQLFESLTTFDATLTLRPALAASWRVEDEGRRVTFRLRDGLTFSDGRALGPADVVRSWLRIVDPEAPSPLASLMLDVRGAADRLAGRVPAEEVGLRADANSVVVDLVRPGADFPAIVASPTFAVVPPRVSDGSGLEAGSFVASGGYVLEAESEFELILRANDRYWAGAPAVGTVRITSNLGGISPVDAFTEGDLDYTSIGQGDAAWIRYHPEFGPSLREVPSLSLEYLGFDTDRAPFDDVRVRQAVGLAVDWRRIVTLAGPEDSVPATSMVPVGVPGRGDADFLPRHDPDAARRLLAEAGYPGGARFPAVTFLTGGSSYAEGILADLERELDIEPLLRVMDSTPFFERLASDAPHLWTLGWVADYPGRNDFLGVLLESGATNNYGAWSSAAFDAAIDEAVSTTDADAAAAAFDRAESVIRDEVPAVPLAYGTGWSLSREGLLGAAENGLGILRLAGLAWDDR
jgi:oligopeptide transport system substrate-binding protein